MAFPNFFMIKSERFALFLLFCDFVFLIFLKDEFFGDCLIDCGDWKSADKTNTHKTHTDTNEEDNWSCECGPGGAGTGGTGRTVFMEGKLCADQPNQVWEWACEGHNVLPL